MQPYFAKDKNLTLDSTDYHHIKNVMRMKKNDIIKIVYDNIIYDCIITSLSPEVKYEVISKKERKNNSVKITVCFSLIKEQKLDYLIQKATELGVDELIPCITKRSVVKIDNKKKKVKYDRWNKICKEASEQSFRSDIPKISEIISLKDVIKLDYDLKLLCSLNKSSKNIKKVLQKNSKCDKIILVFGPEGGFEKEEESYLIKNDFKSVSLGDNVLRAETAVSCALSMIKYELMR